MLWRRLDVRGHDACRFERRDAGLAVTGSAVFTHGAAVGCVSYRLSCDSEWRTRHASVTGFIDEETIDLTVERTPIGEWQVNGAPVAGLDDCVHLDFGFTPATNYPQLRALNLAIGEAAEIAVAWFDVPLTPLQMLPQRYTRLSATTYWYESPTVNYAALLETTADGLVIKYPGLWERDC